MNGRFTCGESSPGDLTGTTCANSDKLFEMKRRIETLITTDQVAFDIELT